MVRVLHAGDFHLDSAFGALTPEQARQRRAESRESVQRLVDWANDHDMQLMLLAGDLFDGAAIGGDTARLLAEALGSFRGQVVIAPGNHDPYTARSAYARTLWPDNVHIFTEDRMQTILFPPVRLRRPRRRLYRAGGDGGPGAVRLHRPRRRTGAYRPDPRGADRL